MRGTSSLPAQAQQPAKHDWENVSMLGATAVALYRCRRCGASFSTAETIPGGVGPCTAQQPTSAHTAGRLHFKGDHSLTIDSKLVATVHGPNREANAARLALAWNSHDMAVEALEACASLFDSMDTVSWSEDSDFNHRSYAEPQRLVLALLAKLTA